MSFPQSSINYPVVRRERFGARGIHLPQGKQFFFHIGYYELTNQWVLSIHPAVHGFMVFIGLMMISGYF